MATGSVENLKPEVVMNAFCEYLGMNMEEISFAHHRVDVYARENDEFVSLDKVTR